MSLERRMSAENFKMLIDLKHRKENFVKGGGDNGERMREEKMGKWSDGDTGE